MGGDGGGGGGGGLGFGGDLGLGTGSVSGMGNAGFGDASFGGSLGGFGMGFGGDVGTASGGGIGAGPGGTGGPGTGGVGSTPGWNQGQAYPGQGALGTPYPTTPTWGSGGNVNFNYPTPQEVYNTTYTLPHMQAQTNILGNMGNYDYFRNAIRPDMQGMMKALGRSGLPSSGYADRNIAETLGSLFNKWQWNTLTGYQNIGAQMPGMMNQWYQPYDKMLGYIGS